jgi:cystathionine beta-lyase/cystathionine gamma-synthase
MEENLKAKGPGTRAVHAARGFDAGTGAVMPPVFLTSTFERGNEGGFDYTRSGNPNFRLLDQTVAALEGAEYATCFGSGVSAITAVVSTLESGSTVLAEENIYGCTYRLFDQVFGKFGVKIEYADFSNPSTWEKISHVQPELVWLESPTNPSLKILDLAGICAVAKENNIPVLVDNTFASPLLQQPLALDATLSLLSTTKYINGHSDCLAGAVATNDREWQEKMVFAQKALGLQPSPFDAWLTSRGARTLELRMERHCENTLTLAKWLECQQQVKQVRYPFLPSHPQHELARKQMKGGSGLLTIELDAGIDEALRFCEHLQWFTMAESLGGVESLICHPASMTHASVPREVRLQVGIADGLLRLSVGIENTDDLIEDLEGALKSISS